jgi:hypothetical protein
MVNWRRGWLAVMVFGVLGVGAGRVVRAVAPPVLGGVSPVALTRGQSIEVAVSGQNLGSVAAAALADARGVNIEVLKADKPNPGEVRLKVTAAADAALGDREARLVGPAGVTRPLHVFVSQYPVVPEKEPNNAPEQAQAVALPATLVGRIDAAGDIDQFRFHADKGQTLIFDVHATRNGSPLEAVATLHAFAERREMRACATCNTAAAATTTTVSSPARSRTSKRSSPAAASRAAPSWPARSATTWGTMTRSTSTSRTAPRAASSCGRRRRPACRTRSRSR